MSSNLAAAAQALGVSLSAEQCEALDRYLALLQRWNRAINLTAVDDSERAVRLHLLDCLAALPALRCEAPAATTILDVGSGGGLPGLVWALVEPARQVSCVDAVGKKVAFIQQAAGALGLRNLHAVHARVEQLVAPPRFDLITSRAFASLPKFTSLTRHLLAEGGCWLAMKGRDPADERAALPDGVRVFHVEPLQVPGLDAQRCLVWMKPAA